MRCGLPVDWHSRAVKKKPPSEFSARSIREKMGLNRDEFAAVAGVSRRTVEGWEAGRAVPKPTQMLLRALSEKGK